MLLPHHHFIASKLLFLMPKCKKPRHRHGTMKFVARVTLAKNILRRIPQIIIFRWISSDEMSVSLKYIYDMAVGHHVPHAWWRIETISILLIFIYERFIKKMKHIVNSQLNEELLQCHGSSWSRQNVLTSSQPRRQSLPSWLICHIKCYSSPSPICCQCQLYFLMIFSKMIIIYRL